MIKRNLFFLLFVSSIIFLTGTFENVQSADKSKAEVTKEMMKAGAGILCSQPPITGVSTKKYDKLTACNNAANKTILEKEAVTDGIDRCKSKCDALSCDARISPANPTGVHKGCRGNMPAYGTATADLTCKCIK